MVDTSRFIHIKITPHDIKMAQFMAKKSEIGGVSRIFTDRQDRLARQAMDALVGQLGTLAGYKYMTGGTDGYIRSRYMQNKTPHQGDGGEDIVGANIDFKASLWRYPEKPYHLCVRPRERHEGWVYIHALVPQTTKEVLLTGWASDAELPAAPNADGPLAGAFALPLSSLHAMMPIQWRWFT